MFNTKIDRIFKAFSDETRLRILNLLTCQKELCVCELIEILRMRQSKISRHLAYLRNAGLVKDRKDGLWCHYSLTKPQSKFHKNLIKCLGCCLNDVTLLKKDKIFLKNLNVKNKIQ